MNEGTRPPGRRTERMLATLATCPRRYQIEYIKDFRMKGRRPPPWPPRIKTILRDALRDRDFAAMRGLNRVRVRAAAEAVVVAYRDELTGLIGSVGRDERDRLLAEIADIEEAARGVLAHYEDVLGAGDFDFMVDASGRPLVDRVVEEKLDDNFTYAGRIDGVVERGELGPAVLIRRFTSNADPQSVVSDIELDLRVMGAMWIASRAAGQKVTSAVIEVVRTKPPSLPEPIQCRTCKGNGTVEVKSTDPDEKTEPVVLACESCNGTGYGGISKRGCDTTFEVWCREVERLGLDVAAEKERCAGVVSKLIGKGETFAYRVDLQASDEAIHAWKRDVGELVDLSTYYERRNAWPRNSAACMGRSGPCPYRKTCGMTGDGDAAWFTVNVEAFPGLD